MVGTVDACVSRCRCQREMGTTAEARGSFCGGGFSVTRRAPSASNMRCRTGGKKANMQHLFLGDGDEVRDAADVRDVASHHDRGRCPFHRCRQCRVERHDVDPTDAEVGDHHADRGQHQKQRAAPPFQPRLQIPDEESDCHERGTVDERPPVRELQEPIGLDPVVLVRAKRRPEFGVRPDEKIHVRCARGVSGSVRMPCRG
jgi:hypothetical protein